MHEEPHRRCVPATRIPDSPVTPLVRPQLRARAIYLHDQRVRSGQQQPLLAKTPRAVPKYRRGCHFRCPQAFATRVVERPRRVSDSLQLDIHHRGPMGQGRTGRGDARTSFETTALPTVEETMVVRQTGEIHYRAPARGRPSGDTRSTHNDRVAAVLDWGNLVVFFAFKGIGRRRSPCALAHLFFPLRVSGRRHGARHRLCHVLRQLACLLTAQQVSRVMQGLDCLLRVLVTDHFPGEAARRHWHAYADPWRRYASALGDRRSVRFAALVDEVYTAVEAEGPHLRWCLQYRV